ncbi:MBL fold metallo-hydrolase [Candidatus Woesearchaeota archaeon]|nr:MBL fold metallo-hydrolase [Candidatus Woesearchaeota archaeon]
MIENIKWLGHAGFKIKGEKTIYIDPFKIKETEPADIIIITHEHFDHLSPEDINKVQAGKTIVVTTPDCLIKVSGNIKAINPGTVLNVDGIQIEAVPAYNTNKQFHPRANGWVGVIVTVNGKRIYHAGDTDNIPEMAYLKNIDIALLPVSGTYVMTAEEAADAANKIMPKVAVPMHYGSIVGTKADAEKFKKLCKCKVEILG